MLTVMLLRLLDVGYSALYNEEFPAAGIELAPALRDDIPCGIYPQRARLDPAGIQYQLYRAALNPLRQGGERLRFPAGAIFPGGFFALRRRKLQPDCRLRVGQRLPRHSVEEVAVLPERLLHSVHRTEQRAVYFQHFR